jgi:hypothetical protein
MRRSRLSGRMLAGRAAKETPLVDGTQLKAVQEPLKQKYRDDPASALIT